MLIYCDPPYKDTSGYSTGAFNHDEFWDKMREWSLTNYVFISEESAPPDFTAVWEKQKRRTLSMKNPTKKVEKLFVYNLGLAAA